VEAPRGTLTHHYVTDEKGIVKKANMVVGTTNNYAPISLAVKKAAQAVIRKGQPISEGMLNRWKWLSAFTTRVSGAPPTPSPADAPGNPSFGCGGESAGRAEARRGISRGGKSAEETGRTT